MVAQHPVGDGVELSLGRRVAEDGLHPVHDGREEVRVVVAGHLLDHRGDALEPHPRVHPRARQRGAGPVGGLVVLHEDEVPDLQPATAAVVQGHAAVRPAAGARLGPPVVVELARGAAGPHVAHHPEVGGLAHPVDPLRGDAERRPGRGRLLVLREDGEHEAVRRQAQPLGHELVGVPDGLPLEVVAEAEVPQHLEEGVVAGGRAHVLQVVVLAAHPHALLDGHRPPVGPLLEAQEDVLELDHPGVGKEQGGVARRHQGRARDARVALLLEVPQERLPDLRRRHHGPSLPSSLLPSVATAARQGQRAPSRDPRGSPPVAPPGPGGSPGAAPPPPRPLRSHGPPGRSAPGR